MWPVSWDLPPLSTDLTFSSHPSHWNVLKPVPVLLSLLSISSKQRNSQIHLLSIATSPPQQNSILIFFHLLQINLDLLRLHKNLSLTPSKYLFWSKGPNFNSIPPGVFSKTKDLNNQNPTVISHFIPILVAISLCLNDSEARLCAVVILDGSFQSFGNSITGSIFWAGNKTEWRELSEQWHFRVSCPCPNRWCLVFSY